MNDIRCTPVWLQTWLHTADVAMAADMGSDVDNPLHLNTAKQDNVNKVDDAHHCIEVTL